MKKQSKLPLINVVMCDSDSIQYAFAISTISANLNLGTDPIILLDMTPALLGSDEKLKQVIANEVRNFQYSGGEIYDETKEEKNPPYPEQIRFYLIDIGPGNDDEMALLASFSDKHDEEIVLWVDTRHDWLKGEIHYINYQREVLRWDRASTTLKLLGHFGYKSSAYWQEAEAALIAGEEKMVMAHPLAERYFKAYRVAKVMDINLWEDNTLYCFLAAVRELGERKTGYDINSLNRRFSIMIDNTAKLKNRMRNCPRLFPLSQKINRPVGYINIGRLSNLIDIDEILAYGQKKFPWLAVVEYSGEGGRFVEAVSARVDLGAVNWPVRGKKDELTQLLKALDSKLADYKEPRKILAPNVRS